MRGMGWVKFNSSIYIVVSSAQTLKWKIHQNPCVEMINKKISILPHLSSRVTLARENKC